MTALTFQQRRADFEDILERAVRVIDNTRKPKKATPETPGLSLARLADEAAGLCREWLATASRAAAGESSLNLSSAVTRRALTVAAHCLQDITALEVSKGVAMRDILSGTNDAAEIRQALTLATLACDAVCTAVAAERGLWKAES